jgi:hypothetical protein
MKDRLWGKEEILGSLLLLGAFMIGFVVRGCF